MKLYRGGAWALGLLFGAALMGCGPGTGERPDTLDVYAASSLTEAFQELEREFEAAWPGTDVRLTFAGSQVLRLQIQQGARADVFASANSLHMDALEEAGLAVSRGVFAHNALVVVVPDDNPAGIRSFRELPRSRRLVVGQGSTPVGRYTREVLKGAGEAFEARVLARVVSEELNARMVRAKVELGEADAAVIYRSDAVASRGVRVVPIDESLNVRASYLQGGVKGSPKGPLAERWMSFVASSRGAAVLARHGFSGT